MGSSPPYEAGRGAWLDAEFSKLAGRIESLGRELESLRGEYGVVGWPEQGGGTDSGCPGPEAKRPRLGPTLPGLASEENSLDGCLERMMFDSDSCSSFTTAETCNGTGEAKKQRLVLKLKRITKKYFVVNKLPIKDAQLKKRFVDYEYERYFFIHYVNDLPKTYRCKLCPKVYNKVASLQFHKRTHSKLPPGYNVGDFARRFSNHAGPIEAYMPAAHNALLAGLAEHPSQYPGYSSIPRHLPAPRPGTVLACHQATQQYISSGLNKLAPTPKQNLTTLLHKGRKRKKICYLGCSQIRFCLYLMYLTARQDNFHVGEMLGEGGFAKVWAAVWENGPLEERDAVLKVQSPANDWEWYILNQVSRQQHSCSFRYCVPQ